MKERSGKVGATGVAAAVRELHARCPEIRIHLVGHSLGARLMAACAKALADAPMYRPDSMMLLDAAFSHFGFSADNGRGHAGFFRTVIEKKVVKGPFVSHVLGRGHRRRWRLRDHVAARRRQHEGDR